MTRWRADPQDDLAQPGEGLAESAHRPPYSPLHAIAAGASVMALWHAAGPLRDFDSLWHVQLGGQIAHLHRVSRLPGPWLGVQPRGRTTSQRLSELGMYALTSAAGWRALLVINVVLMLALLAGLAVMALYRQPAAIGVPVFVLSLAGSAGAIQQRPQAISLVLMPLLAMACWRLHEGRGRPPLLLVAGVSVLWAQFHGLWILAPAAFALVAAGVVLDRPRPFESAVDDARPALWCLIASMAGVLNPHGFGSFALPFRFQAATRLVTEWWPTTFAFSFTMCWGALLLATFTAWARAGSAVPSSEVLWVLCWTVFGLQSYRNVTVALLLLLPVTVTALRRVAGPRILAGRLVAGPQESRGLALLAIAIVSAGLAGAGLRSSVVDPLRDIPAASIAGWVARQPAPVRIWNSSNSSGALIALSDGKARLVVDGRADLWGAAYLKRLHDAELLRPGWQATLNSFSPQAVVTERTSALFSALSASGWQVPIADHTVALLVPGPGAAQTDIAAGVRPGR